jgi:hypothetical protein
VTKFTLITSIIHRQLWITFYPEKRRLGKCLEVIRRKLSGKVHVGDLERFYFGWFGWFSGLWWLDGLGRLGRIGVELAIVGEDLEEKAVGLESPQGTAGAKYKVSLFFVQRVGTLTPSKSDHVLPALEQALEGFGWLSREANDWGF